MKRWRAVDLALGRGWVEAQQWLGSELWDGPRQVRHVVDGRLVLAANRRSIRKDLAPLMTLPQDVHEVYDVVGLPWVGRAAMMLSAADVARERGWNLTRPWVTSGKWRHPKQVRHVRLDRVHMAVMNNGRLFGSRCVLKFPLDIHVCEAPS